MRILQVGSSLFDWGGIERYVVYLTQGLQGRGHDVTVACPPGSPLDERNQAGKFHHALRKQFSLRSFLAYRRYFQRHRFDIVHIHFSPDFIGPALAAKQVGGGKVVMTRHVVLPWSAGKVRRYTRLFDHIIPVSHAVEQKLQTSGVPAETMTVAKAGTPALQSDAERAEGDREYRLGSFGRLVPDKGIDVLLKALARTKSGTLAIFGDGPQRSELEALSRQLELGGRAQFRGFVPNVADSMNVCDVIVVPSTWDEAFPYSVLEAMSLGKPVVASRTGGLPEIVEDGITGRLFERSNVQDLAQVLDEMGEDASGRAKMGEAALRLHRAEYTVEKMAERIEAVYTELLSRKKS